MLESLLGSFRKTVAITLALDEIGFVSTGRSATLGTAVRIAPDGRVLGFGVPAGTEESRVEHAFSPSGIVNERALESICRRGLAEVLGSGMSMRPHVVVHGAELVALSRGGLERVLRAAGARKVQWGD